MSRSFYLAIYVCSAILFSSCANSTSSVQPNTTGQIVTTFANTSPTPLSAINQVTPNPTLIPASQPVKVAEETAVPREIIDLATARPATSAPTIAPTLRPTQTPLPRPTATIVLPTSPPLLPIVTPTPAQLALSGLPTAPKAFTVTPFPALVNRNQWVFSVTPKQPLEGGTVTIAWDLKGESNFDIWIIPLGSGTKAQSIAPGVRLPSTGNLSYILPSGRKFTRFSLTAQDQVGFSFPDIIIEATCINPATSNDGCQNEAANAQQLLTPFAIVKPASPTPNAKINPSATPKNKLSP